MKQSKKPIWKRSMLQHLNLDSIRDDLNLMSQNGDPYGYASDEDGYYLEYKELFDELSDGAWRLLEAIDSRDDMDEHWDDATVALLGETQHVVGYDSVENDYFSMVSIFEDVAQTAAADRLMRLSKRDLIDLFRKVLAVIVGYADIKAAHDCLTSIVQELDGHAAMMKHAMNKIDQLYSDLTGRALEDFDTAALNLPGRMWVE